jgi:hypothetical protein
MQAQSMSEHPMAAQNYQTQVPGPTPHGGDYSILCWKDSQGRPTAQALAMQVEIIRTRAFLDTFLLET